MYYLHYKNTWALTLHPVELSLPDTPSSLQLRHPGGQPGALGVPPPNLNTPKADHGAVY